MRQAAIVMCVLLSFIQSAVAADWPMYRADAGRTGYTAETLPDKLSLRWIYRARHAPAPAWPRLPRMPFDRAYQTVIADGVLYFGSSANCKVYALDAATGRERWSVFTHAPVRFAPAVWKDRVFVASDDGYLYCLAAGDGKVLWKRRGGPDDRMVLGNGRMVSRWPARGGPVVVDNVVYFAAGIWPTEGVYVYALDAATGRVLWCNDKAGSIEMSQPHPTAVAKSGVAAQGYLVAAGDKLFLPTGRGVPAAFNRADGRLLYFHLQRYGHYGGTPTAVIDDYLFNGDCAFAAKDGKVISKGFRTLSVAAAPGYVVHANRNVIAGVARAKIVLAKKQKRGDKTITVPVANTMWNTQVPGGAGTALIVAGKTIVSSAPYRVTTIDLDTREVLWSAYVGGVPHGLAVSDGRLYVSTDRGEIYCFDGRRVETATLVGPEMGSITAPPMPDYGAAAREIIKKTGITEGYCLDLGCGAGLLAYELARRSNLRIYAVDPDPENVKRARRKLDRAGLYGLRVTVHQGDPARTTYPKYFADLIVSGRSVAQGRGIVPTDEMARVQRPYGGIACIGRPGSMTRTVRGPIEGAGNWTHQYCNAANTCCSSDTVVKGPLGILWFDSPDLHTPNRHGRGPAPLFMDGRVFVAGLDAIRAVDAYNGRLLWEYPVKGFIRAYHQEHLMGVAGTNSSYCAAGGSVYVGVGSRCIRIDAATGKRLATFRAPLRPDGKPGRWGYIACVDGLLFGTLVNEKHLVPYRFRESDMRRLFTESVSFFALDAETGKPKWSYTARRSIRNNAIAIGGGRVYLIDRSLAFEPPRRAKGTKPHPPATRPHLTGELLTFDAQTGKVLWRSYDDIYGTVLALSVKHDALLMCYQKTRFRLDSERGGRFTVFRASDGEPLWARRANYDSRPLINGRTIYAQPGAWDLLTGEPKQRIDPETHETVPWQFTRSYGCGIISASRNLMLFRSATLGYIDLLRDKGTENFGGIRPGCWINTLPVGGIVVMPNMTNVCGCSYLNRANIALLPVDRP